MVVVVVRMYLLFFLWMGGYGEDLLLWREGFTKFNTWIQDSTTSIPALRGNV